MRCALLCCLVAGSLRAQEPTVVVQGRIVDGLDSAGISGARVGIPGTTEEVRADGYGRFRLYDVPRGKHRLAVRAIGYEKTELALDLEANATVDIVLARTPQLLSQMSVVGRSLRVPRGFEDVYRRAARGAGRLITREQIDSANPLDLKAVLATQPGLFVNDNSLYFTRCDRDQTGQLWIDGQRVTRFRTGPEKDPMDFTVHLARVHPRDVQAVEIYTSQLDVPGEFLDAHPCAVVAIWTRRGP